MVSFERRNLLYRGRPVGGGEDREVVLRSGPGPNSAQFFSGTIFGMAIYRYDRPPAPSPRVTGQYRRNGQNFARCASSPLGADVKGRVAAELTTVEEVGGALESQIDLPNCWVDQQFPRLAALSRQPYKSSPLTASEVRAVRDRITWPQLARLFR
jgi:hypothetical protein